MNLGEFNALPFDAGITARRLVASVSGAIVKPTAGRADPSAAIVKPLSPDPSAAKVTPR